MNSWLNSALTRAQCNNDWLHEKRAVSLALLQKADWPTRKTENWKYTSLKKLEQTTFIKNNSTPATKPTTTAKTIPATMLTTAYATMPTTTLTTTIPTIVEVIPELNSIDVIFIDGVLQNCPSSLPEGLFIAPLDQAPKKQQQWAINAFSNAKPEHHLFGLVNDVLAKTGVLIDIADNTQIEQPIRIVQQMTENNEAYCRTLVRIGIASNVTVIEQFTGSSKSFNSCFAEYELAEAAELEHYRLAMQSGEAISIGGSHFNLDERARLHSTLIGYGSDLARIDIDVNHNGKDTVAKLNAIYLLNKQEHFDLHSTIEHKVPHGTTHENIRGIVGDKAHAIFNGRIHIHRHAQKTLAELNNRNLLLSHGAEVDTKPELEIYADDVSCAHGATIAEIDQSALFYLRSRGISLEQALLMLNFGFINELIEQIPNTKLADWLRHQLSERFQQMKPSSTMNHRTND